MHFCIIMHIPKKVHFNHVRVLLDSLVFGTYQKTPKKTEVYLLFQAVNCRVKTILFIPGPI